MYINHVPILKSWLQAFLLMPCITSVCALSRIATSGKSKGTADAPYSANGVTNYIDVSTKYDQFRLPEIA